MGDSFFNRQFQQDLVIGLICSIISASIISISQIFSNFIRGIGEDLFTAIRRVFNERRGLRLTREALQRNRRADQN